MVPVVTAEALATGADELLVLAAGLEAVLVELLLEQPAAAIADSATAVRAKRRMLTPWFESSRPRSAGLGDFDGDVSGLNGGNRRPPDSKRTRPRPRD
jgi:hypothetical protein